MNKLLPIFSICIFFIACNAKDESSNSIPKNSVESTDELEDEVRGNFNVDGISYSGKISTQYFGSDKKTSNFSVLCQQDEPFSLLQITFANEDEARFSNPLVSKGSSYKVSSGEYTERS